jgi:hypothetical protein
VGLIAEEVECLLRWINSSTVNEIGMFIIPSLNRLGKEAIYKPAALCW